MVPVLDGEEALELFNSLVPAAMTSRGTVPGIPCSRTDKISGVTLSSCNDHSRANVSLSVNASTLVRHQVLGTLSCARDPPQSKTKSWRFLCVRRRRWSNIHFIMLIKRTVRDMDMSRCGCDGDVPASPW